MTCCRWSSSRSSSASPLRASVAEEGSVLVFTEGVSEVMFKFTGIVMKFAPFGVGAAIAYTVGHSGMGSLSTWGNSS